MRHNPPPSSQSAQSRGTCTHRHTLLWCHISWALNAILLLKKHWSAVPFMAPIRSLVLANLFFQAMLQKPIFHVIRSALNEFEWFNCKDHDRSSQFCSFLSARTYRGFNLSNTVADVTLENNLSRVVTAVSHAFTSSTSRALTVSFQTCLTHHLYFSRPPV